MFVSSVLAPTRTQMCDEVEALSSVLNICCCVIHCKSQTVAVLSVYRSPSTCKRAALADLEAIFTILSSTVNSFIMAGDLNINLLSDDSYSTAYLNLLSDFYLAQHVVGASRVTDTSSTLIDHVIGSSSISMLRSIQMTGLSDHKVQIVNLDYSITKPPIREQYV